MSNDLIIYQGKNGEIAFQGDFDTETIWATQKQISDLFQIDQSVVSRHIAKVFKDKEIGKESNMQKMHIPYSDKPVTQFSLDVILSVGYRTNSKVAIDFRKWATKTLKQHLIDGYTINKTRIAHNYNQFLQVVTDLKVLLPKSGEIDADDALALVRSFASTWMSLDAYDTQAFPKTGVTQSDLVVSVDELTAALQQLRRDLIEKQEATALFGTEKTPRSIDGIVGNVFQTFAGQDVYPTVEEKAAHLLYFMVKNHPFNDGNKRSGALAFVWFLKKYKVLPLGLSPEALTTLTLLVAESDPSEMKKIIGLVLLLLRRDAP